MAVVCLNSNKLTIATKFTYTLTEENVAVIATIGVQDNICPPHTNIAPYNNLPAGTEKKISFNPENAHQVAANWYDVYMAYFASKYQNPTTTGAEAVCAAASQQPCYNLCGQRVAEPAKGLYVAEGKKFVVR